LQAFSIATGCGEGEALLSQDRYIKVMRELFREIFFDRKKKFKFSRVIPVPRNSPQVLVAIIPKDLFEDGVLRRKIKFHCHRF